MATAAIGNRWTQCRGSHLSPFACLLHADTTEDSGFQANNERIVGMYSKYSSIDDRIDMLHYYTTLAKFGIGRATYDVAQEIRNGKITRDEGVQLVQFDQEFPTKYFKEFCEYILLSGDQFRSTVDRFRSPHLWNHENGVWNLRHAGWHDDALVAVR